MKVRHTLIVIAAFLAACSNPAPEISSEPETKIAAPDPVTSDTDNIVRVPVTSDPAKAQSVHAYVKAYNMQDIDAMLALATNDLEWLSIDGPEIQVGAIGAANVRETMLPYFESCPSCRSNLKWTKTTEDRVVALEEAVWDKDGQRHMQSSLSVYEFEGEKIKRVYYFPEE